MVQSDWLSHWTLSAISVSRNNYWKPLFEVNFSKNSTKTIRLFAVNLIWPSASSTNSPHRNVDLII